VLERSGEMSAKI
jgi:hypothetical protein